MTARPAHAEDPAEPDSPVNVIHLPAKLKVRGFGPSRVPSSSEEIVEQAASVKVFQRTPGWVLPRPNLPQPGWLSSVYKRVPTAQALAVRRDALLRELEELEKRRRAGAIGLQRYTTARQRLVSELEHIYGELEDAGEGPQGGGEGIAA